MLPYFFAVLTTILLATKFNQQCKMNYFKTMVYRSRIEVETFPVLKYRLLWGYFGSEHYMLTVCIYTFLWFRKRQLRHRFILV